MKKKFACLFLGFIFITSYSFSQEKLGGKATYKVTLMKAKEIEKKMIEKLKEEKKSERMIDMIMKMYDLKELYFTLLFNEEESLFYKNKMKEAFKGMLSIISPQGKYYTNTRDSIILNEKESFDRFFLVSNKIINWKFIEESKVIRGYKCFKAIGTKKYNSRRGFFDKEITVWYTKEIPYNHGPADYGGVPGFVVKVELKAIQIELSKLNLDVITKVRIKKPTKGKKITHEELQVMSEKMAKESMMNIRGY